MTPRPIGKPEADDRQQAGVVLGDLDLSGPEVDLLFFD
jgi:hypothetical protein